MELLWKIVFENDHLENRKLDGANIIVKIRIIKLGGRRNFLRITSDGGSCIVNAKLPACI
jgi:hypothetical protein